MKALSKYAEKLDRLSLIALCLFAGECVLGASGRWISFGPLSIRIMLFAVCFMLTLPSVLVNFKKLWGSVFVKFTLLFGFYMAVAAVIGWRRGNNLSFIKADITGLLCLALLPGFLATVCNRKRLNLLVDVIFYCTLALGFVTVCIHFCGAFLSFDGVRKLNIWLNSHSMGGLAYLSTGILRIYIRSQIFLQVGMLIGLYKIWSSTGRKRWLLMGAMALIAFACLLTYTRGFWLGFALSAVLLLILTPSQWKRYLVTVGVVGALLCGLFLLSWCAYDAPYAAQEVANRFNPNLFSGAFIPIAGENGAAGSDTTPTIPGQPEDEPDGGAEADQAALELRQKTLRELNRLIGENPIMGNGLGTNLDGLRDDGKTEYMYHDMLMKLGMVGFLLFVMVFFLPVIRLLRAHIKLLKNRKSIAWGSPEMCNIILAVAFVGVAITSYVNPFLINPMGILLVMLLAAAVSDVCTSRN